MSHVVKIDLQIRDLEALSEACVSLGLELLRGKRGFRKFWGEDRCDHCITIPGDPRCLEIGVVANAAEPGTYELAFDPWPGGYGIMDRVGGESCARLRRTYAERATIRKMEALGYVCAKEQGPEERVKLTFSRQPAWVAVQRL